MIAAQSPKQAAVKESLTAQPLTATHPFVVNLRRKLERWELAHLRQISLDQSDKIELLEENLTRETDRADYWQAECMAIIEQLRRLCAAKNCTPGQIALAWIMGREQAIIPIPGTKRIKYLEENVGAAAVTLTPQERADLEALIPVANGTMPLIVTVRRAADIQQVLRLAREEGVKIILDGAEEAWLVADQIAAANVPVLLNPISNLPGSLETRAARMQNAAVLDAAGVVIAIKGNDGSHRVRETRYNAGNAVSHGLPYDAAIEAITVNPAKIFGMAGQFGELRAGAAADVVIWSGDPLEPLSNAETIFIGGAEQAPTSRQFLLRDRYASGGEGAMPPAYTR
jgi:hypothetical protein